MVSDLFVQGKPVRPVFIKTRGVPKKGAKAVRPATVPVERKENIAFPSSEALLAQPSCSSTNRQTHTRAIRSGKTLRPKMKRDGFRLKSDKPPKSINHIMHNMQNTNCLVRQRLKIDASKLNTIKEKNAKPKCDGTSETDMDGSRVQLREICFVKDGEAKKVIAKYTSSAESKSDDCGENLIVSWDPSNTHATVFSQKQSLQTFTPTKSLNEPGCSKQGGFRVHNFARSGSFNKNKRSSKRSLRRLAASADQTAKTDKLKKRKKAKGKIG